MVSKSEWSCFRDDAIMREDVWTVLLFREHSCCAFCAWDVFEDVAVFERLKARSALRVYFEGRAT
jgi:hypothetical protein